MRLVLSKVRSPVDKGNPGQWRNLMFEPGGQSLSEGCSLVTVGGPTSQNAEKNKEMIVNLLMSWMSKVHTR